MAAPRAYWTGQLRLSLVAFPIELYSATASKDRVSFHQIHEPTGKRIRYEKTVPGVGPVSTDEIVKGYEYEKGNYVLLTEDELDAVKLDTRKTLELVQFVDDCEIDPLYFEKPYFVVPGDELAEEAFRVIRDALRETKKVGLGQMAIRGREYIAAIKPYGKGLLLETLRFQDEVRKADPYFRDISDDQPSGELLDVAKQLIQRKAAPFDAGKFKDHYAQALRDLVEQKLKAKGRKVTVEKEERRPAGAQVIDLMGALKRSLEKSGEKKGEAPQKKAPAAKAAARKRKTA